MASLNRKQLKKLKAATGGDPELFKRVMAKASQAANDPSARKIARRMAQNKSKKNISISDIKDSILNDSDMLQRMGLPSRPSDFPEAPPEAAKLFESMASGSGGIGSGGIGNGSGKPDKKLEPCVVCQTLGSSKCNKCHVTFYCSKKCLKANQKKHKKQCGKLANEYYANLDREAELKAKLAEIEAREEIEDEDDEDDEEIMNALNDMNAMNGESDDGEENSSESDDDELKDMMN